MSLPCTGCISRCARVVLRTLYRESANLCKCASGSSTSHALFFVDLRVSSRFIFASIHDGNPNIFKNFSKQYLIFYESFRFQAFTLNFQIRNVKTWHYNLRAVTQTSNDNVFSRGLIYTVFATFRISWTEKSLLPITSTTRQTAEKKTEFRKKLDIAEIIFATLFVKKNAALDQSPSIINVFKSIAPDHKQSRVWLCAGSICLKFRVE